MKNITINVGAYSKNYIADLTDRAEHPQIKNGKLNKKLGNYFYELYKHISIDNRRSYEHFLDVSSLSGAIIKAVTNDNLSPTGSNSKEFNNEQKGDILKAVALLHNVAHVFRGKKVKKGIIYLTGDEYEMLTGEMFNLERVLFDGHVFYNSRLYKNALTVTPYIDGYHYHPEEYQHIHKGLELIHNIVKTYTEAYKGKKK